MFKGGLTRREVLFPVRLCNERRNCGRESNAQGHGNKEKTISAGDGSTADDAVYLRIWEDVSEMMLSTLFYVVCTTSPSGIRLSCVRSTPVLKPLLTFT